jgi:uncharacterized protein YqhQ
MLVTGTGALMRSADISEEGKPEDEKEEEKKPSKLDEFLNRNRNLVVTLSAILGILLSVGLFILLPRLIVHIFSMFIPENLLQTVWMSVVLNIVEGILRLMIFLIYLINASRLKDVKRVWQYHGAEHKAINCLECGDPLTPENVIKHSRFHKRCGTTFVVWVLIISIIFFAFINADSKVLELLYRFLLIPVIAGVSYEFIRYAGLHNNTCVRIFSVPGFLVQRLTTREPDIKMAEVAIKSVEAVLDWKEYQEAMRNNEIED